VPTSAELAREVGADEQEVAQALEAQSAAVPLDPSMEANSADESLDDRLFLSGAVGGLDERERRILYLRYIRDLEPDAVARELGISRRQLSRNTQAALAKLRGGLEGTDPKRLPTAPAEPKMASVATRQTLTDQRYLDQPYHIELVKDAEPGGGWTAQVEELSGCAAHGATPDEAARGIEGAMREWIADALANGREVPKPRSAASHSGRLLVRMPQSLHGELARAADREEVSLNQFITSSLASAVGWRRGADAAAGQDEPEPAAGPSGTRVAIMANIAVLAIVAVVAVVLLIIAVSRGL
jgi:predicted RNase H-like HicB family nuclease